MLDETAAAEIEGVMYVVFLTTVKRLPNIGPGAPTVEVMTSTLAG
jgi:hypothetical protein